MLLKTAFFFSSLLLINFILEVKSDKSEIENNRFEINHYGQIVRNSRPRDQNTRQDETLNTPEEQDLNTIDRLEHSINLNGRYLQRARDLFPQDYNSAEVTTQNQLYSNLQSTIRTILEQRNGPALTQEQIASNRQLVIQRLLVFNDHLIRCLSRYSAAQRQREEDEIRSLELILNESTQYEKLQRNKESQHVQMQRQEDYNKRDMIEKKLRGLMVVIRDRHVRQLPLDDKHGEFMLSMRRLWNEFSVISNRINERRNNNNDVGGLQENNLQAEIQDKRGQKRIADNMGRDKKDKRGRN